MNLAQQAAGPGLQLGPQERNNVERRAPARAAARTGDGELDIRLRIRPRQFADGGLGNLRGQAGGGYGFFTPGRRHDTAVEQRLPA